MCINCRRSAKHRRYFTRLWCTFEIATFMKDLKRRKNIEFMPLKSSAVLLMASGCWFVLITGWNVVFRRRTAGRLFALRYCSFDSPTTFWYVVCVCVLQIAIHACWSVGFIGDCNHAATLHPHSRTPLVWDRNMSATSQPTIPTDCQLAHK